MLLSVEEPGALRLVGIVTFSLSSLRQTRCLLCIRDTQERNRPLCGVRSETHFPKHIILQSPALAHRGVTDVLGTPQEQPELHQPVFPKSTSLKPISLSDR